MHTLLKTKLQNYLTRTATTLNPKTAGDNLELSIFTEKATYPDMEGDPSWISFSRPGMDHRPVYICFFKALHSLLFDF